MRSVGLRARVTTGFAVGALLLSAVMASVSYQLVSTSLIDEREKNAIRAAYVNAAVVSAGLAGGQRAGVESLRSLDTGSEREVLLRSEGAWYGRAADEGFTAAIPPKLQLRVEQGRPAVQRIRTDGVPAVVVAVPLSTSTAFYEIDSLRELNDNLRLLALVLTAVAIMTAVAGAALGWYAGRYVLRPLAVVAEAAHDIATGELNARLDPAAEPDLARLTTSFNHMVDQLSARMQRDRRFAADVSHELRSPLQTLSAAVSVVTRRREHLDERTATALGLIADEITRFQALVHDLLELARSDQPAQRTLVDIADLARLTCRSRNVDDGIVQVEPGTPAMWLVDRRRIEQLLANLLDNAEKYGGGPIALRIGHMSDGSCFLEVDDDGPGVSAEDRDSIFDRFVRGRTANSRGAGDGTGLGLALVAQHAAAHGGHAGIVDRPSGGARFRAELKGCTP
jgi:two-component system, OmpR family, sensor histidine kinase MtrB